MTNKEIKILLLVVTVIFMLILVGIVNFSGTFKSSDQDKFCTPLWIHYPKEKIEKIIIYPISMNLKQSYSYCKTIDKIIIIDNKKQISKISEHLNGKDYLSNYTSKIGVKSEFNVLLIGAKERYFIFNLRFLGGFSEDRPFLLYDQYKTNDIYRKDISLLHDLYDGHRVNKELYSIFKTLFKENNVKVVKYNDVPNYNLKDYIK